MLWDGHSPVTLMNVLRHASDGRPFRLEREASSDQGVIGGSRRITRLEAEVRRRLDRIVEKGLPVVIGDANGADRAVQRYLNDRRFEQRRCVWRYGPPDSRQRSDPGRCTVAGRQGGREFGPPVALFGCTRQTRACPSAKRQG